MSDIHNPYSENVLGTVIGPISHRYRVIQPNGTIRPFWAESKDEAIEIRQRMIDQAKDGCRQDIFELIYGKGEWKLEEEYFDE